MEPDDAHGGACAVMEHPMPSRLGLGLPYLLMALLLVTLRPAMMARGMSGEAPMVLTARTSRRT